MTGTTKSRRAATSGRERDDAATSGSLNWKHFDRRCLAISGEVTHEGRAKLAGIPLRTYYRWRSTDVSLTVDRVKDIAEKLETPWQRLVGGGAR
jgi:hypothetical protein